MLTYMDLLGHWVLLGRQVRLGLLDHRDRLVLRLVVPQMMGVLLMGRLDRLGLLDLQVHRDLRDRLVFLLATRLLARSHIRGLLKDFLHDAGNFVQQTWSSRTAGSSWAARSAWASWTTGTARLTSWCMCLWAS